MPAGQLIKKASLTTVEKGQMSNVSYLECIIGLFEQEWERIQCLEKQQQTKNPYLTKI